MKAMVFEAKQWLGFYTEEGDFVYPVAAAITRWAPTVFIRKGRYSPREARRIAALLLEAADAAEHMDRKYADLKAHGEVTA